MGIAIVTGGETGERGVSIRSTDNVVKVLDSAGTKVFIFLEAEKDFWNDIKNFDLVVPMIHGAGAEDSAPQFLLEKEKVPFLFSDPEVHRVCLDKTETKRVVGKFSICSPRETNEFPLFAKP